MTTLLRLVAATLAAGAVALVLGTAPSGAASAGNSVTYQDSAGEDPAALDIQQIVVSNDDTGMLTFEIHLGNAPSFSGKNDLAIFIDTDNNSTDGAGPNFDGAELLLDVSDGSVDLARWNGSKFEFSGGSPASLTYAFASGVMTVRANANDLGLTSFGFWIGTVPDYSSNAGLDVAPDAGHGTFAYQVKITPPAVTTTPKAKPTPKVPKCKKGQKSTKAHRCHK
jgi:hypothetical protein